jgi:hypothetical protein
MPEDTGFYIDDVCIPHTWYPIDARNNLVSFQYNGANLFAYVTPGNYSTANLGLAIATAMNEQMATIISLTTERFQSTFNSKTNQLSIGFVTGVNNRSKFEIYTDEQLRTIRPSLFWLGKTMNTLLKNTTSQGFSEMDFVSGYVDIYPLRNIYMTASGLGNFNTMSVAGDRNIVKKIPVNAEHGQVIFDQTVTGMDYLDCSRQTLSRLSFALRDVYGTVIDLNDNHISFSIVFSRVQDGS